MIEAPIEQARRINRTWIVHGNLAADAERYLAVLESRKPTLLREVCERAVAATRKASKEQRDPKPGFYAELFRHATEEEQRLYLDDHPWTLRLLRNLREREKSRAGASDGGPS